MRTLLLLLALSFATCSFAQSIRYTLPEGFENALSAADYRQIADESLKAIRAHYAVERMDSGTVYLKPGAPFSAVNLHNLVQRCLNAPKAGWSGIINDHFSQAFQGVEASKALKGTSLAELKQYLSLRIYPEAFAEQPALKGNVVRRIDIPGTVTIVMLDLPTVFKTLGRSVFEDWHIKEEEVFRMAQDNVNRNPFEKVSKEFDLQGTKVTVSFIGEENYAASLLLDLPRNAPEFVGKWGTVVAVPNKGIVNLCRVDPDHPVEFVKFIEALYGMVNKAYTEHPQPVSNRFFWFYEGKFAPVIVMRKEDGSINVLAPNGLTALMTEKK